MQTECLAGVYPDFPPAEPAVQKMRYDALIRKQKQQYTRLGLVSGMKELGKNGYLLLIQDAREIMQIDEAPPQENTENFYDLRSGINVINAFRIQMEIDAPQLTPEDQAKQKQDAAIFLTRLEQKVQRSDFNIPNPPTSFTR